MAEVCKIYDGGVMAANKVNLHIKDRKFVVLVGPYVNQPAVFGVRPEDIGSERAEMRPGSPRVKFKIEVMEPMGAEAEKLIV